MDALKTPFCLLGGNKFASGTSRIHERVNLPQTKTEVGQSRYLLNNIATTTAGSSMRSWTSWAAGKIKPLSIALIALALPFYLAGCGGTTGIASQITPPANASSGTTGTTGTSGNSGTSGTSGSTGTTGTSGSGSTGSTSTGTSGSTGTASTGSGGTGNSNSGTTGTTGSGSGSGADSQGTVILDVQTAPRKWNSWGQGGPNYVDCSPSPCNGYAWSMKYGITLPSLSNDATQFIIDGTKPYGDALFSAELIGSNAPDLKDDSHTLLPTLHNFTYDTDFYVTNVSITQTLEFDVSMYLHGIKMVFGTQCSHMGDKSWDIYDNVHGKWVSAGVPCKMVDGWNHLTIHVQREADNTLLYQSIELDGTTYKLNKTYPPGTSDSSWWGLTVNYQMDGDSKPDANTTYLDNFSFTYS